MKTSKNLYTLFFRDENFDLREEKEKKENSRVYAQNLPNCETRAFLRLIMRKK